MEDGSLSLYERGYKMTEECAEYLTSLDALLSEVPLP